MSEILDDTHHGSTNINTPPGKSPQNPSHNQTHDTSRVRATKNAIFPDKLSSMFKPKTSLVSGRASRQRDPVLGGGSKYRNLISTYVKGKGEMFKFNQTHSYHVNSKRSSLRLYDQTVQMRPLESKAKSILLQQEINEQI